MKELIFKIKRIIRIWKYSWRNEIYFIKSAFHELCYKLSVELCYGTHPVSYFCSIKTAGPLKDCDLDCLKCYPRKVIFNGKTHKYMVKINYALEWFQESSSSKLWQWRIILNLWQLIMIFVETRCRRTDLWKVLHKWICLIVSSRVHCR